MDQECSHIDRSARNREAKAYAQRGLELAKSWRLAAKAEREMIQYFDDLRRYEINKKRRCEHDLTQRTCRRCGLVFASHLEKKAHNERVHFGPIAKPYVGILINPMGYGGVAKVEDAAGLNPAPFVGSNPTALTSSSEDIRQNKGE